ncbi:MAG: hypothetical protein ABIH71_02450 [Candidatus Omnitrophota bacterium]|nr:hypothetical protein [Candidatus Omnitrophota bacterium]
MRKSVVLVVVMIVLVVLSGFAVISLYFMSNEARIAEHKVQRMKAFYTVQSAVIDANQRLKIGGAGNSRDNVEDDINSNFGLNNLNVTMVIVNGQKDCTGAVSGDIDCCAACTGTGCMVADNDYCSSEFCNEPSDAYCADISTEY